MAIRRLGRCPSVTRFHRRADPGEPFIHPQLLFSALSAAALAQPTDEPFDHEHGQQERDDYADASEHIGENNSRAVVDGHDARGRLASMPL